MDFNALKELGLGPWEIILIMVIIAMFTWIKKIQVEAESKRTEWHAETRKQVSEANARCTHLEGKVEIMERHIDDCERDRVKLSIEQVSLSRELDTMKLLVATYRNCAMIGCPMKRGGDVS